MFPNIGCLPNWCSQQSSKKHRHVRNFMTIPFIPILTVLPEYGGEPFLWIVSRPDERGVGPNLCDGLYWDEAFPLSEGLWRKFVDWTLQLDHKALYVNESDKADMDWEFFHERGLQLTRWLKEDVGDSYQVVYMKTGEDPEHRKDERREMLSDGTLAPLISHHDLHHRHSCCFRHIISGGQTGADRAALDFAIKSGYTHGGWVVPGREAEDGSIPMRYHLVEVPQGGYRQRTKRNVADSDGTLIVNFDELNGGTLLTQTFAQQINKPYLVVQLDSGVTAESTSNVIAWLMMNEINSLNVAGPRESKRPGIYKLTRELLDAVDVAMRAL